jgi:hypothetical protein
MTLTEAFVVTLSLVCASIGASLFIAALAIVSGAIPLLP